MGITFWCGHEDAEWEGDGAVENITSSKSYTRAMLEMLGLPLDDGDGQPLFGSVPTESLNDLQRQIIFCINNKNIRSDFTYDTYKKGNWTFGGVTDDNLVRELKRLSDLVKQGIENRCPLHWR